MSTMTEPMERPSDAAEWDMLSDADDNTIMLLAPDDPAQLIGLAVIEDGNIADPAYVIALSADQAIQLAQALVKAGVRKQVIAELKGG